MILYIYITFAHSGYSIKAKKVAVAYQRALDIEQLMYHAMADVVDEESGTRYLYLLSKAQASYSKDAKTRNKTKPGLKSKIMFSIARPAVATFFALNQQANAAQYRDPAPWESSNKEK